MSVYVDDMRNPLGRMLMCHMLADTAAELHAMADRIGVARRHHQGDHYDICLAKRALAVRYGAREVTRREMVRIRRRLREATEALTAIKEAQYLADQTGWPHAIVDLDGALVAMKKHRAHGHDILETVHPVE